MYDKVIILGIFISLIYTEITNISPSGLIVPGYIALNLNNVDRIILTLLVSLITYLIIRLLSKYIIIYGRRQFAISVALAILVNYIVSKYIISNTYGAIGNIIPGIIANSWINEGIIPSIISLFIVVLIIGIIMMITGIPVF